MRRAPAAALLAVLLAGCGAARQDADEPSGTFKVEVVSASFPRAQHIAESVTLRLRVRNADTRALPVAVTVETKPAHAGLAAVAFGQDADDPELADSSRPIWVLDEGPVGGDTADVDTWTSGVLAPGASRVLTWHLVAVKAGAYTLTYRVSPSLTGKARAAASGRIAGALRVRISDAPVPARVGADGQIIRGS